MSGKTTAQRLRDLLIANPEGMTVHDLREHMHTTTQNVRQALSKTWGCYVAEYRKNTNGPATAIWKCVTVPESAQRPSTKWTPEFQRKYNREWAAKKKAKVAAAPAYQPQGLTVIRGPWPTH